MRFVVGVHDPKYTNSASILYQVLLIKHLTFQIKICSHRKWYGKKKKIKEKSGVAILDRAIWEGFTGQVIADEHPKR